MVCMVRARLRINKKAQGVGLSGARPHCTSNSFNLVTHRLDILAKRQVSWWGIGHDWYVVREGEANFHCRGRADVSVGTNHPKYIRIGDSAQVPILYGPYDA